MRLLSAALIFSLLVSFVFAQKSSTILGDAWTGEVVAASDATREITLRHPDKNKAETFVGILAEGYKVKTKDGSLRELRISEMTPGTRVRVFYKKKQQEVGGQKVEVRSIYRVDFLGVDEYTKLREALELEPRLPVTLAGSGKLATANPLKIYLAIEPPHVKDSLVAWVDRWNREEAAKYGSLELVSEPAPSDISLIVYWGRDEIVASLPAMIYDQRGGTSRDFFPATAHLVTKDPEGLKVLWEKVLLLSTEKTEGATRVFEKEIEKRIKARMKK